MQDKLDSVRAAKDYTFCFACIDYCHTHAIQTWGKKTEAKGRYHHPQVPADDIAGQKNP